MKQCLLYLWALGSVIGVAAACGGRTNREGAEHLTGGAAGSGGDVSSASAGGRAGSLAYGSEGPSCSSMTGTECGAESCCTSIVVPGGTFPMGRETETCVSCTDGCPSEMECNSDEQPERLATVSSFALDRFEVTVGRFRAFIEAGGGTQGDPPAAGSGAHPLIAGSGWDGVWNTELAVDQAALIASVSCASTARTWTHNPVGSQPS